MTATTPLLDRIASFRAPPRVLMGPGPSEMDPLVLEAMAQPPIGHLDPAFLDLMEELKALLQYAFRTRNTLTFPVSGPGSVGMESCFVNMVTPGDRVVVCRNGVFGSRMIENVERCGGIPEVIDETWGRPVDPNRLEDRLKSCPDARLVAFVHAETSTGCVSDARLLTEIAHRHGCMVIADAVTSLGGSPLEVDGWGIDAVYSASQKCLSFAAGISPVSYSQEVVDRVRNRSHKVQSWFMDLGLIINYWANSSRMYHHTAPINALFGLHEALLRLKEEGIEASWARHRRNYLALKAGLESMGLDFLVAEEARLPQLSAVNVPDGIDEAEVRRTLLADYNLEIGAGLGPLAGKVWRFGLMGYSSKPQNVMLCLSALGAALAKQGMSIEAGRAEEAAERSYSLSDAPLSDAPLPDAAEPVA